MTIFELRRKSMYEFRKSQETPNFWQACMLGIGVPITGMMTLIIFIIMGL